jgi:hypothetical protein
MTSKFLSLVAGVAALGLVGAAANAAEPMHLTDAQMDSVTAGLFDLDVTEKLKARINVGVDIDGNLAKALAAADAYGKNTLAETVTVTETTKYSSSALSQSLSATDNGRSYRIRY